MRKTIGAVALLLALLCSAHAGEMQNGIAPPNPATSVTQETTTADGIMQNGAADSLTQTVLDLLAALPSLL